MFHNVCHAFPSGDIQNGLFGEYNMCAVTINCENSLTSQTTDHPLKSTEQLNVSTHRHTLYLVLLLIS